MLSNLDANMAIDTAYSLGVLHARSSRRDDSFTVLKAVAEISYAESYSNWGGFDADMMQRVVDAYHEGLDLLWHPNESTSIPRRPGSNPSDNLFYDDGEYWANAEERAKRIIRKG